MKEQTTRKMDKRNLDKDANRDPITGAPGAHPVGTGVGAAGGGAAGAAIGTAVGGPIGGAIGLAAGAIAGGLAGKAAGEAVDPTREDAYWRENYRKEPYVTSGRAYDDYQGAYRTGYEGYSKYGSSKRRYEDVEPDLRRDYEQSPLSSRMSWEEARPAARAAWHRLERALPGDADRDGR
jgi:hypothetical protein